MEKFKNIILELTSFFGELAELEKTKLTAIVDNNIKLLEECMSKEQVGIMQLKVLEKHRADIQKELGWESLSFQEVIHRLDGDAKEEFTELYQKLADALTVFNNAADSAKTALEANLYSIDAILHRLREKEKEKENKTNQAEKGFSEKRV